MKNNEFCHLHVHNQYSLLDGFGSEQAFAKKAKALKFKYLALTNHGNIDGLIKHQRACVSENIIPLFGAEMYIVSDISNKELKADHITLLVKNQSGWETLCRLLTFANLEGFYKRPKIDHRTFMEEDLSGLIILTGCTASFLRSDLGEAFFWNLVDERGKDLYLEIMPHDMPEQIEHNKKCKELSMKYGIPLVATNDCHYINEDENVVQEVLLAVQTHVKWNDKKRWKFDIKGLHLRSYEEMKVAFKRQNVFSEKEYVAALHQTIEIAKKCEDFRIEKREVFLPKIKRLKKYSIYKADAKYLSFLCIKGKGKIKNWTEKYQSRLQYELEIIKEKKFERYFLIVWDLVRWCKKNKIMIGSGRGSVGGSLMAYLLNITCVDPIKYNLLFSRFINEERIDLPDIDIDFEHKKRDQVRQYLIKKYGEDNVAGISTFLEMKGKAAVRDVSRVFDIPLKEADEFAKAIEYGNEKSSINEMLKTTREGKLFKSKYPLQAKYSSKLEGTIKSTGQHAAAVIISPKNLKDGGITNLCRKGKDKIIVVNWDMEDAEYMGLVKLDILGLSTLSILSEANKLIEENHGKKIKFEKIRPINALVFDTLTKGETVGVFQLSTPLSTDMCKETKIDTFEDIASVLAIARPGSLHSGMTKNFIDRKHGKKWKAKNSIYEKITEKTYGVLIYQEQVMEVFHKVAGLPYSVADNIRKIIGKKRDVNEFEQYKERFLKGCLKKRTFNKEEVEWFWEMLLECSDYLFNRSHAIEYAMLAYWTAWTKYFYPTEFICASLSCGEDLKKEELIKEAYRIGLKVVSPKIGISDAIKWKAKDNSLYCPFIEIKGFGESTALKCIEKTLPNNTGFFELFPQREVTAKTKIDKILNEIKAFDKDTIPENINRYFSFNLLNTEEQQIKILEKKFSGYENNELRDCKKCELTKQCKQPLYPSKGIYNIMIIGEAPGYEDDQQGRNFIGAGGKMIWEELEKYKLEKKMFHVTNICKCYPSKSKTLNDKQLKICFENWLLKEIKDLNCSLILSFGNAALKALSDKSPKGITKMNGKIEWSNKVSCPVCYVISPSAVLRGSIERKVFNQGIKVFAKKVKEGLKT